MASSVGVRYLCVSDGVHGVHKDTLRCVLSIPSGPICLLLCRARDCDEAMRCTINSFGVEAQGSSGAGREEEEGGALSRVSLALFLLARTLTVWHFVNPTICNCNLTGQQNSTGARWCTRLPAMAEPDSSHVAIDVRTESYRTAVSPWRRAQPQSEPPLRVHLRYSHWRRASQTIRSLTVDFIQ